MKHQFLKGLAAALEMRGALLGCEKDKTRPAPTPHRVALFDLEPMEPPALAFPRTVWLRHDGRCYVWGATGWEAALAP